MCMAMAIFFSSILQEIFIEHATYNRMKGVAEYKKINKEISKIKECLYLLKVF